MFTRSATSLMAIAGAAMAVCPEDFRHEHKIGNRATGKRRRRRVMIPDMCSRLTRVVRRGYVQPIEIGEERRLRYMHAHARRRYLIEREVLWNEIGRPVPPHGSGPVSVGG